MVFDRKTCLVQYIAVEPLTFYATADGTDLIQDILRKHLVRDESKIVGQEGAVSVDDHGEFLTFEPTDTKNRILHLPIEHLAFSGALRRMKENKNDQRNPDQIEKRQFENVHLANRYPQDIIGPSIFVAIFHGFDNALCYIFITQSSDDACLLVMKLMHAFRQHEQQGQIDQGPSNQLPSSVTATHENPFDQSSQSFLQDNRQLFVPSTPLNVFHQDGFVQNLLAYPNLEIINQPTSICYSQPPPATIVVRTIDSLPCSSTCALIPQETVCCEPSICTQYCSPLVSSICVLDHPLPSSAYGYSIQN